MEKIITPEFRVSFPNLNTPKAIGNGKPKYSIMMLFDKKATDIAEIKRILKDAVVEKFEGKTPKNLHHPIKDGDTDMMDDGTLRCEKYPEMAGNWIVNASSLNKPSVVDQNVQPIIEQGDFYAGCFARASVHAFAYAPNKKNPQSKYGVALGLNNVQKLRDGDSFGGGGNSKPEDDFEIVDGGGSKAASNSVNEESFNDMFS